MCDSFNEKELLEGDIMADPFTNYKHWASTYLSHIYYHRHNYKLALHYFVEADTVYPYYNFCGNALYYNEVYKANTYADIYLKLGLQDDAIRALLPLVFYNNPDKKIMDRLLGLFRTQDNLWHQLDSALMHIEVKEVNANQAVYNQYSFVFLNCRIILPGGYDVEPGKVFDIKEAVEKIKHGDFYNRLMTGILSKQPL
jgi:tetratricopeptide (TPR) repeat protein